MIALPLVAECRCVLLDGRLLTVTATRRPRANRADVKCIVAGAPALAERMQQLVRLARHTEARADSRDQVVLSLDIVPHDAQRDWELAAVLADRMVRGLYRIAGQPLFGQGWSDAWHLGQVDGAPDAALARLPNYPLQAVLGGQWREQPSEHASAPAGDHVLCLDHLGGLSGHSDPAAAVSSARAWFPLHSGGINDSLGWVEVNVHPLLAGAPGTDEEDNIAAPGLDLAGQQAVRQALAGARHFDGRAPGRWRTVVRFGQPRFHGNSYELALVMADRLARGREFVPRGRLIASGCSSAWHAGRVDSVEGREPKCALILRLAGAGDRVLLPKDWRDDAFKAALQSQGASVGWIAHIGII